MLAAGYNIHVHVLECVPNIQMRPVLCMELTVDCDFFVNFIYFVCLCCIYCFFFFHCCEYTMHWLPRTCRKDMYCSYVELSR